MTTKNIIDSITMSTEIRELNDDELKSVAGGGSALLSPSQLAATLSAPTATPEGQRYSSFYYGSRKP